MSETIERFELETVSDRNTGVLVVTDFQKTLEQAKQIVAEHPITAIENDAQKKEAKAFRAVLNKVIKAIDRRRIDTVADFTQQFVSDVDEIKRVFVDLEQEYKAKIEEYENAQKIVVSETAAPKKYVATVKFADEKIVKKLTEFCQKNGCELTIK